MILLDRDDGSLAGTHGTFKLGGQDWHSLEQPSLGNKPYISCVPEGDYDLIPFKSPKYGNCYIMVNPDLNVYAHKDSSGRPPEGRFLCLFVHRGNYVHNFQGCIGSSQGFDADRDMLLPSTTKACKTINRLVREEGSFRLRIRNVFE